MTQHGSSPGRPRGRRPRHENDGAQQGYDAIPADQREFPDLAPIRPRQARARDGGRPGDWPEPGGDRTGQPGQYQPGQPGTGGRPGGSYAGGGYPPVGPGGAPWGPQGYPPGGQPPGQPAPAGYGPGPGYGQEPAPGAAGRNPAYEQQAAPGRPAGQRAATAQAEENIPDWAEPDTVEAFSERWHRRGQETETDQATRRKRRRLLFGGGGVAAIAIAVGVYFLLGGGTSATPGFGDLVNSFLPGELQSVPHACSAVPAPMLEQYLPGTRKLAQPPLNTGENSQCSWILDTSPKYRVLEVNLEAYAPSALYGNGSATTAAEVNYAAIESGLAKPAAKSAQPKAEITDLSGMPGGTESSAFLATQLFPASNGNSAVNKATVIFRYRNVIETVIFEGPAQQTGSGAKKYDAVAMSDLTAGAQQVAMQVAGDVVG